jgi:hypothetical protein
MATPAGPGLHDWLASNEKVSAAPPMVVLKAQLLVVLTVPDADLLGTVSSDALTCMNHGSLDVAVHVIGCVSIVPAGLKVQFLGSLPLPNDTLVSRNCVCVIVA